jgi:3-deoxy-D-manno-octulosonate 8-phosphate phosphatase (KDO 8-P phosphatase)
MKLETRCQQVELILADVDGVLTAGQIIYDNQGIETKQFHIRVRQTAEDKLPVAQEILAQLNLAPEQACYIGDDLPDVPVMRYVGLGVAVADACAEARAAAHHVTQCGGGGGAVRETIELVLKAQRRWDDLIQKYTS